MPKPSLPSRESVRQRCASMAPASENRSRHSTSSFNVASTRSGKSSFSAASSRCLRRSARVSFFLLPPERFSRTAHPACSSSSSRRRLLSASMKRAARRSASRLRRASARRQRAASWLFRALRRRAMKSRVLLEDAWAAEDRRSRSRRSRTWEFNLCERRIRGGLCVLSL